MDKLKRVTSDTCKALRQKDVVLPSTYFKEFGIHAKELNIDLKNDSVFKVEIEKDIKRVHELIHQTSKNLDLFEKSTLIAKEAIANKDEEVLDECLNDVDSLHKNLLILQGELYTDALSGIYNRRWINEKFLDENGNFRDDGVFIFLDLNKFKNINDTYGHLVGDNVIKFFATFLKEYFNHEDIARFAGDEFIIFCSSKDQDIEKMLEKSLKSLEAKKLVTSNNESIKVSFSYGVENYKSGMDFGNVFDKADRKMYKMKEKLGLQR